ncbi:MAG: ATP-dependent DNA helicase RecG [Leptospirillia bacterium]
MKGTPEPLADLLGPLSFAARDDSPIERISGLPDLLCSRIKAWRTTLPDGAPGHRQADGWLTRLAGYEKLTPEQRRARLKTMLADITALSASAPSKGTSPTPVAEKPPRRTKTTVGKALLSLSSDVRFLPGVGERRVAQLARLGISTVEDLLLHLPTRYEDRSAVAPVAALVAGESATVCARVVAAELSTTPHRRMKVFEAALSDESGLGGVVRGRWFNQPYKARQVKVGDVFLMSGKVSWDRNGTGLVMENPEIEPWEPGEETLHAGRIVPIYPATEGITSRQLRAWVAAALARVTVDEVLPAELLEQLGLAGRARAFRMVHRPERDTEVREGTRRLAFEEFFFLQVGLAVKRRQAVRRRTHATLPDIPGSLEQALTTSLPFSLTEAQRNALDTIFADMARHEPMQRLLQGDVGCGKTVVALLAMLRAVDAGFQGAIMAPTEILAVQHANNIRELLGVLPVKVELLVGGQGKKAALTRIADGSAHIVVGTQALIQNRVDFHRLGLAVVDEQHRFGVRQRAEIGEKGAAPHTLIMTATPIPRSLAMTLYGDLELTVIDGMPPGRKKVATRLFSESKREEVYRIVRAEVEAGRRAFVVFPLVEESEKIDLKAATEAMRELSEGPLKNIRLGLVSGRMKGGDKARMMADFAAGRVQVLIATTVVEVGVDVPEASVMVVEHAERFGLSQLHQLRGRVGRGRHKSRCLLVAGHAVSRDGRARLKALVSCSDGFSVAEKDLEIRGPGELFGKRQSGLPELKVANLIRDAALLASAREAAGWLVEQDPALKQPVNRRLKSVVSQRWRHHLKWGAVG